MMTKNPQQSNWDFEENTNVQYQNSSITNKQNKTTSNNSSININNDRSTISAKTK